MQNSKIAVASITVSDVLSPAISRFGDGRLVFAITVVACATCHVIAK